MIIIHDFQEISSHCDIIPSLLKQIFFESLSYEEQNMGWVKCSKLTILRKRGFKKSRFLKNRRFLLAKNKDFLNINQA